MNFFKLLSLLGVFFFSFNSYALTSSPVLNSVCEETDTDFLTWNTCIIKTVGSKSKDVIFYLHGNDHDERSWLGDFGVARMLRDYWQENNIEAPTIVSLSFGPIWLLVKENGLTTGGLLELVSQRIYPRVISQLGLDEGKRILLGESMGGFNALQLYFEDSFSFDKAAFVCPAIVELSPFATEEEKKAYILRTKADPEKVNDIVRLSKFFIPSLEFWEKTSPLKIAKRQLGPQSKPIYLSASLQDNYGFYEGSLLLKKIANEFKTPLEWRPISGKHCSVDITSLGTFLTSKKN
jgi:hypothetical protein